MQVFKAMAAAVLAAVMSGGPIAAQSASQANPPAELPPANYTGNQHVDSTGCVFIRAEVGGQVTWVPRLNRDRQQVCGTEPAVASGSGSTAEATGAPQTEVVEAAPQTTTPDPSAPKAPARTAPTKVVRAAPPADVRLVKVRGVDGSVTYCVRSGKGAQRYLLSDGRRVTQCGARAEKEPVAYLNGLAAPGLTVTAGEPGEAEVRRALKAEKGAYRPVWSNGELNAAGQAALARDGTHRELASGGSPVANARFVQVGAYSDPANADRTVAHLKALDLPVTVSRGQIGRRPVQLVLAGPFDDAGALTDALSLVRRSGYADAYPRK